MKELAIVFIMLMSTLCLGVETKLPEPASLQKARQLYNSEVDNTEKAYHKALAAAKTKLLGEITTALQQTKDTDLIVTLGEEMKKLKEQIAIDDALATGKTMTFRIAADKAWQPTIGVKKGMVIAVKAEGTWGGDDNGTYDAEGKGQWYYLQAKIGNGQAIKIGRYHAFVADDDGDLQFQMHDNNLSANKGSLNVSIVTK